MELIDRYLAAIKSYLPRDQYDVVAELSDALLSRCEERETELGRPLTAAEQEAVIREYGHPMLVAGRYLRRQHLIGPDFFPVYWYTLRAALWVALIFGVCLTSLELLTTGRWTQAMAHGTYRLAGWALAVVGGLTIIFAVLDSQRVKLTFLTDWKPGALPVVDDSHVIPRGESIFGIVMLTALILWWIGALRVPSSITAAEALGLQFAPSWQPFYVPILLLWLVDLARLVIDLLRPYWTPLHACLRLATNVLGFVVIYALLRAGDLVTFTEYPMFPNEQFLWLLNWVIRWSLVGLGIMSAVESLKEVRRLVRRYTGHGKRVSGITAV